MITDSDNSTTDEAEMDFKRECLNFGNSNTLDSDLKSLKKLFQLYEINSYF